ncbi:metabotropic glutamate receptor 7-like [Amphiura filiformis]|uniref:metabotropic glutamate receptor 7-like n=1 Tax=Amphiura filiformis TaxID=82378 RepID=UPI003B21304B
MSVSQGRVYQENMRPILYCGAVIIWGSEKDASGIFSAASRIKGAAEHFVWICSDFWSGRQLATIGNEAVIEGAITVQPLAETIPEFDDYFTSLKPSTNGRNPWFHKYWAEHFNCVWTPPMNNENDVRMCNGSEQISASSGYYQDPLIQFIVDAVLAFAHALKAMHTEYCGSGFRGLCNKMKERDVGSLLRFLKNVSFQGGTGEPFTFTKELDGPVRYKILNFQRTGPDKYGYVPVGSYVSEHLELNLDLIRYRSSVNHSAFPDSMCGTPCNVGEVKYMLDDQCCWLCMPCERFEYLQDEKTCDECPVGFVPNLTRDGCNEVPVTYLRPDSEGAISAVALSSLGELATIFVALVFTQYKNTPVVKASGRELSGILLMGIFLCYLLTYLLLAPPSVVSCAVQQFSVGVAFSTCYAALLVKTNRVYRIFTSGKSTTKRPSFISPTSQILITAILIAIEVVLSASWLIALPAQAIKHYPSHSQALLVCNGFLNSTSLLSLAYPLILLILCTAYAFKTRKIPGHFNEAKCIGLTTYTSCVIWLAMVPIYVLTSANIELRIITLYFAISLSATVCLVCLFAPRVYVILFRPERNVRSSTSFVGSRGKGVKGQSKTGLNVPNNLSLNANSINANSSIINVDSKSSKSDDPDGPKEEML